MIVPGQIDYWFGDYQASDCVFGPFKKGICEKDEAEGKGEEDFWDDIHFMMLDPRYMMQDARRWIHDSRYMILDTGFKIHDTGYRIQDARYRIPSTFSGKMAFFD